MIGIVCICDGGLKLKYYHLPSNALGNRDTVNSILKAAFSLLALILTSSPALTGDSGSLEVILKTDDGFI
jgi:hypothetical protein